MDKIIYCTGCSKKVAVIKEGSMLIKGISMICVICETKRKASDLANKTKPKDYSDIFCEMFGGGLGKK